MNRRATYVFKKNSHGEWLCAIDNSYGIDLLNQEDMKATNYKS